MARRVLRTLASLERGQVIGCIMRAHQIKRKKLEEDDGIVDRSPLHPNQEDQVQTSVSKSISPGGKVILCQ